MRGDAAVSIRCDAARRDGDAMGVLALVSRFSTGAIPE